MLWKTTRFEINLTHKRLMGIVNITPDSFSDGGRYAGTRAALQHCERLLSEGADILDIGAESSRPGAQALPLEQELSRILPLIQEAVKFNVPISVDTYKTEVMQAVLDLGVDVINDIWAFRQPGAAAAVMRHGSCGLVMMHMHREPANMQAKPMDDPDVVDKVKRDLLSYRENLARLEAQPSAKPSLHNRLLIDPGIGFGKTDVQNFTLLARQHELLTVGSPILVGWSRKSSLRSDSQLAVSDRLVPSVAAAVLALERGASVVRVHDVRETAAALKVWHAMKQQEAESTR